MRTVLLLFISVCFVSRIFAQSNYKEGYIISNNNDTVQGWIDFKLDESMMRSIKFKTSKDSPVQQYFPEDIFGYRFTNEGKFYVSREIEIKDGEKQLVFLEFLVQGLKNLYYFKDELEYYFIENSDGKLVVMSKNPDSYVDLKVKVDLKYRGVLKYVFKDYELIRKKTESADFSRRSMIELTKDYHNNVCEDGTACIIFENDFKKKFIDLDFSVFGGMQYYRIKFYPDLTNMLESLYASSVIPEIGGQITIVSPRFTPAIGLYGELSYSRVYGAEDYFVQKAHSRVYGIYEYSANHFTGTLGLKYIFQTEKKIRPVIEAGYYLSYFANPECTLDVYETGTYTGNTWHNIYPDYFITSETCSGYTVALQLDYQLKNKKYVFGKVGYYTTIAKRNLYNYEPRDEEAFQVKFGYIF